MGTSKRHYDLFRARFGSFQGRDNFDRQFYSQIVDRDGAVIYAFLERKEYHQVILSSIEDDGRKRRRAGVFETRTKYTGLDRYWQGTMYW